MTGAGVNTLTSRKQCSIATIKEDSVFHVSVNPYLEADMQYSTSTQPWSVQGIAVMMWTSVPGNNFHISVVGDIEYMGSTTEGIGGPNPLVPSTITRDVINAVTKAKEVHAVQPDAKPATVAAHARGMLTNMQHTENRAITSVRKGKNTMRKARNTFGEIGKMGRMFAPEAEMMMA